MIDLTNDEVRKALRVAATAHAGQVDRGGHPYILHPITVASRLPVHLQPAALLHDVIEDTDITMIDLVEAGIGWETRYLVDSMTQRKGDTRIYFRDEEVPERETYFDYIRRIARGSVDLKLVKLADLSHNMQPERWPDMPSGMQKRYAKSVDIIMGLEN